MKTAPRTIARSSALRLVSRLIQPKKIGLGAPMKPRRKYEAILRPSGMFCVKAERHTLSAEQVQAKERESGHTQTRKQITAKRQTPWMKAIIPQMFHRPARLLLGEKGGQQAREAECESLRVGGTDPLWRWREDDSVSAES